jgi:hypothetical protein
MLQLIFSSLQTIGRVFDFIFKKTPHQKKLSKNKLSGGSRNSRKSVEEYEYWLGTKSAYENNLKNNIGHAESIKTLLLKIDKKLSSAVVRFYTF